MMNRDLKRNLRHWKRNVRKWRYGRNSILDTNQAHRQIHDLILERVPTAIGKIGSVELLGLKH